MPQMVWLVTVKRIEKKLSDLEDLAHYWIWRSRKRRLCDFFQKPSWVSLVEPKGISCQMQFEDFEAWTWYGTCYVNALWCAWVDRLV